MKFKKEKKDQDNFLLYIPKKKHEKWEVKNGTVYLIFEHDKTAEKFARWLVKKPYVSDVELDELGSAVWQLIDGKRTLHEIGVKLVEQFGEKCDPIYDRLIMYIRHLNKKGWISFDRGPQVVNKESLGKEK